MKALVPEGAGTTNIRGALA